MRNKKTKMIKSIFSRKIGKYCYYDGDGNIQFRQEDLNCTQAEWDANIRHVYESVANALIASPKRNEDGSRKYFNSVNCGGGLNSAPIWAEIILGMNEHWRTFTHRDGRESTVGAREYERMHDDGNINFYYTHEVFYGDDYDENHPCWSVIGKSFDLIASIEIIDRIEFDVMASYPSDYPVAILDDDVLTGPFAAYCVKPHIDKKYGINWPTEECK